MRIRAFKYIIPFIFFAGAIHSFNSRGWTICIPMMIAWILIPLLELLLQPDPANMDAAEEELARKNPVYDLFLYIKPH